MRFAVILLIGIGILLVNPVQESRAQVSAGITIGKEGVEGFYLAIGDYYKVPEREVVVLKERRIPEEEMPVVLFIAQRARVEPSVVIDLRLGGKSWMDITVHFGLSPEIFYVPVKRTPGPPYGKAYGYYKNKPKKEWKTIVLADADVVNFVNLRFATEYYGYSADEVIKMRSEGKNFVEIHDHVKKAKKEKGKEKSKGKGKRK